MRTVNDNLDNIDNEGNSGNYINYDTYSSSSDIQSVEIPHINLLPEIKNVRNQEDDNYEILELKSIDIENRKRNWKDLVKLVSRYWDEISVEDEINDQRSK